jgi:hypothetical protein
MDSPGAPAGLAGTSFADFPTSRMGPQHPEGTMDQNKRDKAKVDPLSGAEDKEPAQPLKTVPDGEKPDATSATIPGTGEVVKDVTGKEAKRVVDT